MKASISAARHHRWHEGEQQEGCIVRRPRDWVEMSHVVSKRQASEAERQRKFSAQHQRQGEKAKNKPFPNTRRYRNSAYDEAGCNRGDARHKRHLHQSRCAGAQAGNHPQRPDGSKYDSSAEHQREIENCSLQCPHDSKEQKPRPGGEACVTRAPPPARRSSGKNPSSLPPAQSSQTCPSSPCPGT